MSDLVLARNCCLARMLPGEAENGVGMNIVRVAMYFRANFVESCNQIHFLKAETSLKPKKMFPFERKTVWSAILDRKMDTSSSCFDNISHAKQYRNSILVAMPTFLAVGKWMD